MATKNFLKLCGTALLRGTVLLCLVMALAVAYARYSGYELLSVQSDSMQPVMRKGDAVLLNKHDTDVRVGEVVSFPSAQNPKVIITHRVIGVDNTRGIVSTKGDNTAEVDAPVAAWNISGTVTNVIPRLGFTLNLLKHPLGLIVMIYVPALGVILAEVRRLNMYYATGINSRKQVHYRLNYRPRSAFR